MKVYWDYWDWLICSSCASNQVSTLDGVLEVRNEHFWTVGFGSLVRFSARKLCVVRFSKTLDTLNDHSEPPLSKRDVWNELQQETLWRVRLILQHPVWLTIDCRSNQLSVEWLEKELFFTVSPVSLICWNTTWDTTSRWVQSRSSRCFTFRKSIFWHLGVDSDSLEVSEFIFFLLAPKERVIIYLHSEETLNTLMYEHHQLKISSSHSDGTLASQKQF